MKKYREQGYIHSAYKIVAITELYKQTQYYQNQTLIRR